MSTLNLGIVAHVDAGKTSLTERLLYLGGAVDHVGRVDHGSTRTDSLALERRRGITIKSAVATLELGERTVNLIDTPGHPDFIAEVERVLSVLDGAVLVVSAVEGVQPQTRILMRTLRRLRIPTVIFVNKIDRNGAGEERVLHELAERLTAAIVPMTTVRDIGTQEAAAVQHRAGDPAHATALLETLTEVDDDLLAAYVDDATSLSGDRLRTALQANAHSARVSPVYFGSAVTGAGVEGLVDGLATFLPPAGGDPDGPVSGTVFTIDRGDGGERIAYVRLFSGTVRVRDRVAFGASGAGREAKVTAIGPADRGGNGHLDAFAAGQIAALRGLGEVRVGDVVGVVPPQGLPQHQFAPPTLETVVEPCDPADAAALHTALTQLAEQDPLINLRRDRSRRETHLSLYGEVQKEVIETTLADEFGVQVTFRDTTVVCVERLVGVGAAAEFKDADTNPFLATVGLRVEPAPPGSGVSFGLEVELGSMPFAFIKAVEETVRETLRQGLYGWQIPDCAVVLTHSGYLARQSHAHGTFDKSMSSTAGDFRNLTPLVVTAALRQAGTSVHEPVHRFRIEFPADALSRLLPALAGVEAIPAGVESAGARGATGVIEGDIPTARVHELERQLPSLTSGEGMLETVFGHYRPVRDAIPIRARTDHNPLDRKEYLVHVVRRV